MLVEHVCSYRPAPHMFAVFTERAVVGRLFFTMLFCTMVMMSTQRLFMLCSIVYDACINVCAAKFSARARNKIQPIQKYASSTIRYQKLLKLM